LEGEIMIHSMLAWFTTTHVLQALTILASVNVVAAPLIAKVPTTTTLGKLVHTVGAFAPADITKILQVWQAVGKSLAVPLAALCLVFAVSTQACGSTQSAPATAIEEAALFGSQLNLCVQTATTRAQADACRASVESYWCKSPGPLANSSGCGHVSDGGAQ
jgi:hypothetical protein